MSNKQLEAIASSVSPLPLRLLLVFPTHFQFLCYEQLLLESSAVGIPPVHSSLFPARTLAVQKGRAEPRDLPCNRGSWLSPPYPALPGNACLASLPQEALSAPLAKARLGCLALSFQARASVGSLQLHSMIPQLGPAPLAEWSLHYQLLTAASTNTASAGC